MQLFRSFVLSLFRASHADADADAATSGACVAVVNVQKFQSRMSNRSIDSTTTESIYYHQNHCISPWMSSDNSSESLHRFME